MWLRHRNHQVLQAAQACIGEQGIRMPNKASPYYALGFTPKNDQTARARVDREKVFPMSEVQCAYICHRHRLLLRLQGQGYSAKTVAHATPQSAFSYSPVDPGRWKVQCIIQERIYEPLWRAAPRLIEAGKSWDVILAPES